jgi:hypothetical protein
MPIILATWRQGSGGLQFKASLGKQFVRPHLEKNPSQKRAGGVAQGIGPEFKLQYHTQKKSQNKQGNVYI